MKMIESLDPRRLLHGFIDSNGVLQVEGGSGNDVITLTFENGLFHVTIDSDNASQFFNPASVVSYEIHGGAGNDQILLDDTVTVPGSMFGEDGDDTLRGGRGADTFSVGLGIDTVDYSHRTGNLRLSVDSVANDGLPGEGDNLLMCIETVISGSGADRIVGCPSNNLLMGNGGNDTILGVGGNDTIAGGNGRDVLIGGAGADFLIGSGGIDAVDFSDRTEQLNLTIDGVADDGAVSEGDNISLTIENIVGGAGSDFIRGNGKANFLLGQGGDDTIHGGSGDDYIIGGFGVDELFGEAGRDRFEVLDGSPDTVRGGSGVDTVLNSDDIDAFFDIP